MSLIQIGNHVVNTANIDYVNLKFSHRQIVPDTELVAVFFGRDHYTIYRDNEAEAIQKYFQEHVEEVLEVKEEAK